MAFGLVKFLAPIPGSLKLSGVLATAAVLALFTIFASASAAPQSGIAMHDEPKLDVAYPKLNSVNPDAPKGGALKLGALGSFDSLNPFIVKGEPAAGVREWVYETLLARNYDEPFSLYGLIAQTVETPEDRSWVQFEINPAARFSDGKPVTPEDVLFSWELLKNKGRQQRLSYKKVVKAERVGEHGVRFDFEGGDREMPLILGLMPILPRHALTEEKFDKTSFDKPVGTGPYLVEQVEPGESITFRRNPDYWGRDLPIQRGQFNFDTIRIDYYRDRTVMMDAFRKGLYDVQGDSDTIDAVRWATPTTFRPCKPASSRNLNSTCARPRRCPRLSSTRAAPYSPTPACARR